MRFLSLARWILVILLTLLLAAPAVWVFIGGRTIVEVDGESMVPTYQVGDVVIVRPASQADLVKGAVVTAKATADKSLYTHRIVKVDANGSVELKGDGNDSSDPGAVPLSRIKGVVEAHLVQPWASTLVQLQTLPLRICLLVIILGFAVIPLGKSRHPGARTAPARHAPRRVAATPTQAASAEIPIPSSAEAPPLPAHRADPIVERLLLDSPPVAAVAHRAAELAMLDTHPKTGLVSRIDSLRHGNGRRVAQPSSAGHGRRRA